MGLSAEMTSNILIDKERRIIPNWWKYVAQQK